MEMNKLGKEQQICEMMFKAMFSSCRGDLDMIIALTRDEESKSRDGNFTERLKKVRTMAEERIAEKLLLEAINEES